MYPLCQRLPSSRHLVTVLNFFSTHYTQCIYTWNWNGTNFVFIITLVNVSFLKYWEKNKYSCRGKKPIHDEWITMSLKIYITIIVLNLQYKCRVLLCNEFITIPKYGVFFKFVLEKVMIRSNPFKNIFT